MYNQTIFNQGAFNVPFDDTKIILQTDAYETVSGIFGLAVIAFPATNANESVRAQCNANAGMILTSAAAENISGECSAIGTVLLSAMAAETIDAEAGLGALMRLTAGAAENVSGMAMLGANYSAYAMAEENIANVSAIACIVYPPALNAYEIISSICDVEASDILEASIDITMAPGQTLVIDSDNYIVLLDGENIVDKYEGRWLMLDRLVRSVQISAGTAAELRSTVLYTERWW